MALSGARNPSIMALAPLAAMVDAGVTRDAPRLRKIITCSPLDLLAPRALPRHNGQYRSVNASKQATWRAYSSIAPQMGDRTKPFSNHCLLFACFTGNFDEPARN
jgi:hypothetical protein